MILPHSLPCCEDELIAIHPIETAPTLDLVPADLETLLDELHAYHAIYSPLFQRREQRAWSEKYLHGLLLEVPRTSIEPMVLALEGANRMSSLSRQPDHMHCSMAA